MILFALQFFNFIFWYYLYCIAITFIIIPAVIYIILLPDASSRLLIQPNCTLILMLIFPPPPLSPQSFSYGSFHRKNFFFCLSHSTHRMLISCIAFAEWDCLTLHVNLISFRPPHPPKKNHVWKKKIEMINFRIYSINSHYITRQNVIFWITIVLLFFNIKYQQPQADRFSIICLNVFEFLASDFQKIKYKLLWLSLTNKWSLKRDFKSLSSVGFQN